MDEIIRQILAHFNMQIDGTNQALPNDNSFTEVPIDLDGERFFLFLRRSDLYIHGYRTVGGKAYCTTDDPLPAQISTSLGFSADYMSLGWNRTANPKLTVSYWSDIYRVLSAAMHGKIGKGEFLYLAILIEATRFHDVQAAINAETEFTTKQVDWASQVAANNARVRKHNH